MPDRVISIERDKSFTRVKFKGGKEESFDLSKEDDLNKFMQIFGNDQVHQIHQNPINSNSELKVISPFSPGKDIQVIRSDGGEIITDTIPEEIVKDRKRLLKWLKQYGLISEE